MTNRKIRLIIERNKSRFSDNCSLGIDRHMNFMSDPRYNVIGLQMAKWMRDMLGDDDYKRVRVKLEEKGKELYYGKDGMEILIKL